MLWGTISDHYGRRPVILCGLAGTALSSLVFGLADNFWVASAARIIGGPPNGNVAVMQTMVAELCTKPEFEPKAYARPPFMWSFGSIVGAAMGGFLVQPAVYYPAVFPPNGLFGRYPFLLPNLVAVAFIFLAIVQGYLFMEETNPKLRTPTPQLQERYDDIDDERTPLDAQARRSSVVEDLNTRMRRPSFIAGSIPTASEPCFDIRRPSLGAMFDNKPHSTEVETPAEPEDSTPSKAFSRDVILWIIATVIMCYHQMAFVSLLPIYLLDGQHKGTWFDIHGGLGYTVHDVGTFMSVNGVIAMVIQTMIFPVFMSVVGVWRSLAPLIILCPLVYTCVPFVSLFPETCQSIGIFAILIVQNFCLIIIYPCLLIALKNATPSSTVLGKINGLAMSASSGARTIAPPLCGIIYSTGGSAVAWWSIAVTALLGSFELLFLSRSRYDTHEEARDST